MPAAFSNLRVFLVSSGTLFLLLCLVLGFSRSEFSSTFGIAVTIARHSLLDDVVNETLGFQKIFVINLPSRTDRRDSMSLAAALSGLQVRYIHGVTQVDKSRLPPGGKQSKLSPGALGSWRAHTNVLRMIVEQNLTSALILEDDADWDLRIKSQMQDFARAATTLMQPLPGESERFLDPSYPQPSEKQVHHNFNLGKIATTEPTTSPYGDIDRWDLLWLGHCGSSFPKHTVPIGRVVISNDETVPEPQHLSLQFGSKEILNQYPPHTRVVSRASENTCSLAYAVSRAGARRILYEIALHKMTSPFDIMLQEACDGANERSVAKCFTIQPQLFQQHRPIGAKAIWSDISDHRGAYNKKAFTRNIRWSARVNLEKLMNDDSDYFDSYKNSKELRSLLDGI